MLEDIAQGNNMEVLRLPYLPRLDRRKDELVCFNISLSFGLNSNEY